MFQLPHLCFVKLLILNKTPQYIFLRNTTSICLKVLIVILLCQCSRYWMCKVVWPLLLKNTLVLLFICTKLVNILSWSILFPALMWVPKSPKIRRIVCRKSFVGFWANKPSAFSLLSWSVTMAKTLGHIEFG